MKRITLWIALCALAAGASVLNAATSVSGVIADQTWTEAASPYNLTGDVLVGNLQIEPGVQVVAQGNFVFEVPGILDAEGTAEKPILFSTTTGLWKGVYFNQCAPGSRMVHCRVEKSHNSGVRILNCSPALIDCTIVGNRNVAGGGGVRILSTIGGEVVLTRCVVSTNVSGGEATFSGGGIFARTTNCNVVIDGCTLAGNLSTGNGGGVGANLRGGLLVVRNSMVSGNSASGTWGGGIGVEGDTEIFSSVISSNLLSNYYGTTGGGVTIEGNGSLRHCEISANYSQYGAVWGRLYGAGRKLELVNCVVANNRDNGIYTYGTGLDSLDVVNCTIANNTGLGIANSGAGSPFTKATIRNSIVYYNNGGNAQISSSPTTILAYNDIQGGSTTNGNINVVPLYDPGTFRLVTGSSCIDKGDPATAYNDTCLPPSRGTVRNDMGAFGGPGACCWDGPCDMPVIKTQPQPVATCVGKTATFTVLAVGGGSLSYHWYFHGSTPDGAPVPIPDATGPTLTLANLTLGDAGYYSVVVSSLGGEVESNPTALVVNELCLGLAMYAGLTVEGAPGTTCVISYTSDVNSGVWSPLATNTLSSTSWFYVDMESPYQPKRFYKATVMP